MTTSTRRSASTRDDRQRPSACTRAALGEHARPRWRSGLPLRADSYADELPYWVTAARPATDRALHARRQRHAFRHAAGLQHRRAVLHLPEGFVRYPVRGGQAGRRRCCRSGCTAAWSGGPDASRRWPASSTTCKATNECGSPRRVDIARHWIGDASAGRRLCALAHAESLIAERLGAAMPRRLGSRRSFWCGGLDAQP